MPTRLPDDRCADCRVTSARHREVYARGLLTCEALDGTVYLWCACHQGRRVRASVPRYDVPNLRMGDRAYCRYRGCTVVVTSFTGEANWPCGVSNGARRRSAPIVTDELVTAISRETARALSRWLGVPLSRVR